MMVTFAAGETTTSVTIQTLSDSIVESTEMFTVQVSTTDSNVMFDVDTASITIEDNDGGALR